MRTNTVIAAGLMACSTGFAWAGGSTSVDVTASVKNVCTFNATTMTAIELGEMDPSSVNASGVSKTGNITYNCTKGLTPQITRTGGGTTLTDGKKTISYTFSLGTPEQGVGYATAGSSKIVATATVSQAAVQGAEAGTAYKDTVTLSINN